MDTHFLKLLVCPLCNSPLRHDQSEQELICQYDQLAYPIRNGIPIMLKEEARALSQNHDSSATGARPQDSRPSESAADPTPKPTDSKTTGSGQSGSATPGATD
ncbi:hypothetical protein TKWG_15035 [Advenella kashmirensis WT001]|uniref:UPF0434 protein TKWG_15035 n=2 Tax=Advenella kashmirensis TaxID=310575 RepID=I3UDE8_ADVKW|nr:hypothetical protein TKWG_15035 [Advenella kashmirensis WT001]